MAALNQASPQFREWWAEYPVRYLRPATIAIRHPQAGLIRLEVFQLRLVDRPDLIEVIQVPADATSLDRVRSLQAPGQPPAQSPGQPSRPITYTTCGEVILAPQIGA